MPETQKPLVCKSIYGTFESRECQTIGTNFRDIWRDGKLWASEVDKDVATFFITHPEKHGGNSFCSDDTLRRDALEREFSAIMRLHSQSTTGTTSCQ